MAFAQKVILIAVLAIGGVGLLVGLVLMHSIGGFLHTIEEETRESERVRTTPSGIGSSSEGSIEDSIQIKSTKTGE